MWSPLESSQHAFANPPLSALKAFQSDWSILALSEVVCDLQDVALDGRHLLGTSAQPVRGRGHPPGGPKVNDKNAFGAPCSQAVHRSCGTGYPLGLASCGPPLSSPPYDSCCSDSNAVLRHGKPRSDQQCWLTACMRNHAVSSTCRMLAGRSSVSPAALCRSSRSRPTPPTAADRRRRCTGHPQQAFAAN